MMMRNQPAPAVTLGTAVTGVGAGRTEEHSGAWAHSDRHGSQPRHRRGDRPAPAQRGCAVLCTFLRVDDPDDPGTPQEYRDHRAQDAAAVVGRIRDGGGEAAAVEADLSDPATPGKLFDAAEEQFGPVDILVNNATGWLADTFATVTTDRLGRSIQPVPPQPGPGSSPSTRWVRP